MRKALEFSWRARRKVMTSRESQHDVANISARSSKARGTTTALTMTITMSAMTVRRWRLVEASRTLDWIVTSSHCQ